MKKLKHLKNFNEVSENLNISDVSNCLLKNGFEKIKEEDIPNYFDEEDNINSFKNENVYEFGYLTYDDYCIVRLDKNRNDSVLSYKDGSGNFIIKYKNELYIGDWSEGEYNIGTDDNWGNNSDVFSDFKTEMIQNNISLYYCENF